MYYVNFTVFTAGGAIVFSDILKTLRNQKNISQPQLAKEIGVSSGNISDWETGRSKPGYVALTALSRFFEVSADYLLELNSRPVKAGDSLALFKDEQGLCCDGSPLSDLEADLIAMFRLLPSLEREDVFDIIHLKYKRHVEKKKDSIFSTYCDESGDEKSGPDASHKAHEGTA